jgi:hypothetical protein
MDHPPVALGLIACQQAVIEAKTNNVTLVNCFAQLHVDEVPSDPTRFVIFATLWDGEGEIDLEVSIMRLDTDEAIYKQVYTVRLDDRLSLTRFLYRTEPIVFPVEGIYEVALRANQDSIAYHRFEVLIQEPGNESV